MQKMSIETLSQIVEKRLRRDGGKETLSFDGVAVEFTLKRYLSLPERSAFVDMAVAGCFNGDIFIPEYVEVFKELAFYRIFTNLPVPTVAGDKGIVDIQTAFDFCKALRLIQELTKKYTEVKELYESLCECVDKQVAFRQSVIISQEQYALNKMITQIESASEQFEALLKGVDTGDILSALKVVSEIEPQALINSAANNAHKNEQELV